MFAVVEIPPTGEGMACIKRYNNLSCALLTAESMLDGAREGTVARIKVE